VKKKHQSWTVEEIAYIIEQFNNGERDYKIIAAFLPGRSELDIGKCLRSHGYFKRERVKIRNLNVRASEKLHQRIALSAYRAKRSISAEINLRLNQAYGIKNHE